MQGPRGGSSHLTLLVFLITAVGPPAAFSDGNVGCLFSQRLCLDEIEWCFDDLAFGRCMPSTGTLDEEDDLYRYDLGHDSLHAFGRELRRLFALGYRWSHGYTQCRLQAMLFATKNDVIFDHNTCSNLVDQDLEGALKALEGQDEMDPENVAIIKFTPSDENPHGQFADEVYYPPGMTSAQSATREIILPSNAVDVFDMPDPYQQYELTKRAWLPPMMHRRSIPLRELPVEYPGDQDVHEDLEFLSVSENSPEDLPLPLETSELALEDLRQFYPLIQYLNDLHLTKNDVRDLLLDKNYDILANLLENFEATERMHDILPRLGAVEDASQDELEDNEIPERFNVMYNTPDRFRAGWESKDFFGNEELPETRVYYDENDGDQHTEGYGSGDPNILLDNVMRQLQEERDLETYRKMTTQRQPTDARSGIYTEGGVVYVPESQLIGETKSEPESEETLADDLNDLLDRYSAEFKRPERLDVKKPGPPFDAQIAASARSSQELEYPNVVKKEPRGAHPHPSPQGSYDVDTDFVYVKFKQGIRSWVQGEEIISNITKLLDFDDSTTISHGSVEMNGVTFKVNKNNKNLNASEIARRIGLMRDKIRSATGMEVIAAGVGNMTKLQAVYTIKLDEPVQIYVIILLVAGLSLTIAVSVCILLVIRRHILSREKLHGLTRPDTEASKDYQDLCRVHMASKTQQPTTSETVHGRITSLSRESEQSPSSRSSTSSWSEEPALHNMDISTGHMVLSYMEDHLRNKDRLEQEWVALCAYEAEPCASTVAKMKENVGKNRYPDVLPYDHARVVLNDLSNACGSDYINASSITDHDPRNPAYIATQGPLPHTSSDFWQLIWEQGAVVIVMLSRLTEGGAAMCHRYWPEEGSELYHVYEVHLVSEHIWCDDYLVRSFYLKNTRTGETRTVTQFHFLSWPDAGIPASTKAMLEFRRKVNKSYRGRSCPIVVHCSDGAGRTGTYCLIDMVLSRMAKGAKEIDIAATLEHLRDQRPRMVAVKQQFEFVLTAVAEEVHAILKALPPQPTAPASQTDKEKQ